MFDLSNKESYDYFILASTSPRRREFLEILNLPFTVIVPGSMVGPGEIDESPLPHESPPDLVRRLSRLKAESVATHLPSFLPSFRKSYALKLNRLDRVIVIAADT